MTMLRTWAVAAAAAVLAAGAGGAAADAPSVAAAPTEVEIVTAMEQHYFPAIRAHDAMIRGNLEGFRAELAELAAVELPAAVPETWNPFHERLRDSARQGGECADLAAAAAAMAAVALACGDCHESFAGGPVYPVPTADEGDTALQARMREHELSTLLLWDGVTGPSGYAWDLGADAVAETRVFEDRNLTGPDAESLLAREAALRGLASEAKDKTELADRAAIYGRMLATCGGCHQAIGVPLRAQ